MLACRGCGDDTQVVVEEPNPLATDRKQGLKKVRECVSCRARAGTTERWSDDDSAEFYRAKCEQAAEWIGKLAPLLKAPSATARMTEDWIRKDLDRHTAGAGSGKAGGRRHFASTGQKKRKKTPEVAETASDPAVGRPGSRSSLSGAGTIREMADQAQAGTRETHRRTEDDAGRVLEHGDNVVAETGTRNPRLHTLSRLTPVWESRPVDWKTKNW